MEKGMLVGDNHSEARVSADNSLDSTEGIRETKNLEHQEKDNPDPVEGEEADHENHEKDDDADKETVTEPEGEGDDIGDDEDGTDEDSQTTRKKRRNKKEEVEKIKNDGSSSSSPPEEEEGNDLYPAHLMPILKKVKETLIPSRLPQVPETKELPLESPETKCIEKSRKGTLEHTTSSWWIYDGRFNPFKVFEVEHESCLDLEITIKNGEAITKGNRLKDFVDTPDPYVILKIPGCSNPSKRTSHVDNSLNPIWDQTFHFYLDPAQEHNLKVALMDANYSLDESLGEDTFIVNTLTNDVPTEHTFCFPGGSKVHAILKLGKIKESDLRFSLALCEEEMTFLHIRRQKVFLAMKELLGPQAPDNEKQVPILGILGSGGGFRAMMGLSGAIKALHEKGILDCATYIAGLSGSSWYISTLYANDLFPVVTHSRIQAELRESVTKNWIWNVSNCGSYINAILAKYRMGQPVSLTDLFGHILGDVLLQGKKHKKLTDMRKFLDQGIMPLPFFTCLHAKKNVSCRSFSEWVEFSPYEIGIAKYGTFMKTEDFGSKFIVGKKIKELGEFPLHYLQGVWGSAFTILLKRLMMEGGTKDLTQIMREVQKEAEADIHDELNAEKVSEQDSDSDSDEENDIDGKDDVSDDCDTFDGKDNDYEISDPMARVKIDSENDSMRKKNSTEDGQKSQNTNKNSGNGVWAIRKDTRREKKAAKKTGYWNGLKQVFEKGIKRSIITGANFLNCRSGRAGEILNPFRGLSLKHKFPISPFTAEGLEYEEDISETDGFGKGCRYEPLDNRAKKLFVVDSGLSFNSPYPLLLRPQRAVDIYLSFDFSQRDGDAHPPFSELLLAEKWAFQNKILFPPIKKQVEEFKEEEVRECYVFKDPSDQSCPVVLHFPLVNNLFREFKAPGVPRTTDEEKDFANFPIFDDPNNSYSTMNFVYEETQFDRLTQLVEFNTLASIDTIKEQLEEIIRRKKQHITKPPNMTDIVRMAQRAASMQKTSSSSDLKLKVTEMSKVLLQR